MCKEGLNSSGVGDCDLLSALTVNHVYKKWANISFTDGMSLKVGGMHGAPRVWRLKRKKWEEDCIGK